MKINRRHFVHVGGVSALLSCHGLPAEIHAAEEHPYRLPCFVSTWPFGQPANDKALSTLQSGQSLLDAVEQGIRLVEADVSNTSVGAGGTPNAAGVVQLDACLMNGPGHQAGSVAGLEGILHPISVARAVMEKTRHVMLVGQGAQDFAIQNGFEKVNLLSEGRRKAWEEWRAEQNNKPAGSSADNHDTIALIGVAADGTVAGGCSTSGLGYKLPGRVGDSPILGSGLYVDNEVGGAGATGTGENVMRYCATFMIVEAMRHGMSPQDACVAAIRRISRTDPRNISELHINFVAIDKKGNVGAAGTDKDFRYAVTNADTSLVIDAAWVK